MKEVLKIVNGRYANNKQGHPTLRLLGAFFIQFQFVATVHGDIGANEKRKVVSQ